MLRLLKTKKNRKDISNKDILRIYKIDIKSLLTSLDGDTDIDGYGPTNNKSLENRSIFKKILFHQ